MIADFVDTIKWEYPQSLSCQVNVTINYVNSTVAVFALKRTAPILKDTLYDGWQYAELRGGTVHFADKGNMK